MQKINRKIILVIITLLLIITTSNLSFAANSVSTRARNTNTVTNNSVENETNTNSVNQVENEILANTVTEDNDIELSYPDVKKEECDFGPFTIEQMICGATILQSFIGIILAISLYSRNKEDEDDWEDDYNFINATQKIEKEEPKAIKELKDEASYKEPKAIQEMEDQKKLEEIRKAREEKKEELETKIKEVVKENIEEKVEKKEDTASLNYKHQQALDDFYNYAEEIKQEKKTKRGKGKHSM